MKKSILIFMLAMLGVFTACGRKSGEETGLKTGQERHSGQETVSDMQETVIHISDAENGADAAFDESANTLPSQHSSGQANEWENSSTAAPALEPGAIAEQIFEIELSEYSGKVRFTPFVPMGGEGFRMEITQNGNLLASIPGYVPERLAGEVFASLDAVSFYDVNFDGNTDIVLIETYGSTSFAAVYYGFDKEAEEYERYFVPQTRLSEALTSQIQDLSVPGIRNWITGGKKNGEFSSYQEAYHAVGRLCQLESGDRKTYDLIYFNDDDIPELVADTAGYHLSLYTYADGRVYNLMQDWPYGAMGNAGYMYSPGKNSLRNDNADYAGAILYTTYMTMGKGHTLDEVVQITCYNFDDANGNGMPDEEEMGSVGMYGVNYIHGAEASEEECAAYDLGGYVFMEGKMTFDELEEAL